MAAARTNVPNAVSVQVEELTPKPPPELEEPAVAEAPAAPLDDRPRVFASSGLVRIHDKPDRDSPVIGAFRAGQSIVLERSDLPPLHQQKKLYKCTDGWYPVEPRGFVCVGGPGHATLNGDDPGVLAARAVLPDTEADYPFRYGTSVGAPQYLRIPTEEEQRQVEPDLEAYLAKLPAPNDAGSVDTTPAGRGPSETLLKYLAHAQPALTHEQEAYAGYKISWVRELDAAGRTWLLTPDMTLVPKDKVRQKPLPKFHGIDLREREDLTFPLAFFWLEDAKKFEMREDGKLYESDETFARHSFVEATMEQAKGPGSIYWKMRDGSYIAFRDMSIIRPATSRPPGVGPSDKWVEVRVTWGYLIAYEGDTPVYVTAMSPGVDGIAKKGHSTARGKHYVDWKLITGDMSGRDGKGEWFVDEVPWVQYYKGNFALHGAWWHDDYGRPKSHGCVNLAPADARVLFDWMDPVIPDGWYAASTYFPHVRGTVIYLRH